MQGSMSQPVRVTMYHQNGIDVGQLVRCKGRKGDALFLSSGRSVTIASRA